MTLSKDDIALVISMLLNGSGHRVIVTDMINNLFMKFTIGFFKSIMLAKFENQNINIDWYKANFIDSNKLSTDDILLYSGLNKKTVTNQYGSGKKEICIEAAKDNYDKLLDSLNRLIDEEIGLDIKIVIKHNDVSVELNINESLIVVNTLAVKRAAIRGGAWSTLGKSVETPLMLTLCHLFHVNEANYAVKKSKGKYVRPNEAIFDREVDFFLKTGDKEYNCEIKLMGQGNPESADAVIARNTDVFIADKLSETNKNQLNDLAVQWVELSALNGYIKFSDVLAKFGIPHKQPLDGLKQVPRLIETLFNNK